MDSSLNKKTVKVLVESSNKFPAAVKVIEPDGTITYEGLYYDVWKLIKNKLSTKYEFIEEFNDFTNYTEVIESISKGKYDICIGGFIPTYDRSLLVNFTDTIILDTPSVLHFKKTNLINSFFYLLQEIFIIPIILCIIIGLLISRVLIYLDPERWRIKGIKKIHSMNKAFISIFSAFFGESGYLAETSSLHLKGIIILISVLSFSSIINYFLQATITDRVIKINNKNEISRENINTMKIISPKGYVVGKQLEEYGANIKYLDFTNLDDVLKFYINNYNEYDGIALRSEDSYSLLNNNYYRHPNLMISNADFGFDKQTFPVNKNDTILLHNLNEAISQLHYTDKIENICKIYRDPALVKYCVL